jgi:hypothetical protein
MKNPLDFFLASILALSMGLLVYGFVRFPDAPIHPCGVGQFCGKLNSPHTEEQYQAFIIWVAALIVSVPIGFGAGFLLERRSRRRASLAWERLRPLQAGLPPAIEERRYAEAWKDLRRRGLAQRCCFALFLCWVAWGVLRGSVSGGGALLPIALFALAGGSILWRLYFPCPRCGNRFFMSLFNSRGFGERCIHCDLRRGATFTQSLEELREATVAQPGK